MTAVSPPQPPFPPPTPHHSHLHSTYAISFRTPLWLTGPPRNESPVLRSLGNGWGLGAYFQGKPVRSRLTALPPTPVPGASSLSAGLANEGAPLPPLPSPFFCENGGGETNLTAVGGGPQEGGLCIRCFFFVFLLVTVGLGLENWSVDPKPLSWHWLVPGARLRHPLSSPAKELEGWVGVVVVGVWGGQRWPTVPGGPTGNDWKACAITSLRKA